MGVLKVLEWVVVWEVLEVVYVEWVTEWKTFVEW